MEGLLAWAVGKGGASNEDEDSDSNNLISLIFTPEQQKYKRELDQKAASPARSIQDLRLRLPPPDIPERFPHVHAHSLTSNAALALQLNVHSATKEQTQLREVTLQEENGAYVKAISDCENKIQEKLQEVDLLESKFKEMDLAENNLKAELHNAKASLDAGQSGKLNDSLIESKTIVEAQGDTKVLLEKLGLNGRHCSEIREKLGTSSRKCAEVAYASPKRENIGYTTSQPN